MKVHCLSNKTISLFSRTLKSFSDAHNDFVMVLRPTLALLFIGLVFIGLVFIGLVFIGLVFIALVFIALVCSSAQADIVFPADIAPPLPFGPTGIATVIGALAVTIAIVLGGFIFSGKNRSSRKTIPKRVSASQYSTRKYYDTFPLEMFAASFELNRKHSGFISAASSSVADVAKLPDAL
jgi:hypothetical protein